ncbi:hypothetical protein [Cellulomonas sp. SLBN-39]|uniref:DUF6924 domain-containing protein n=1 Tax=Cellulomonas sp. SLBN-39 TaxID=2768446 RepID=UPI0011544E6E|nr:hypothetical protein [Cellulomonas sp. SLBN-39]TQL01524.1 hypothetical protein FBY24_0576 [Cellulomonas sp. SLBN-39]
MRLTEPAHTDTLLLRTDYSDDAAWRAVVAAVSESYDDGDTERLGPLMQPVESPELDGLTPRDLVELPRDGYMSCLGVADAQSMRDLTIVLVDLNPYNEQVGRTFRVVPEQIEPILVNLSIGNMDFFEFADSAGPDGVFRGFGRSATTG